MGLAGAPLLPIAAALAVGIGLASWVAVDPVALLVSGTALCISAGAALVARRDALATLALLTALVVAGGLRAITPIVPADHLARQALPPSMTVEGRLAAEPIRWTPDRARVLLDVAAYRDGQDRRAATGRVQLTIYGESPPLGEGQRVAADVKLHRPVGYRNPGAFDYPAHLRREGILLVGHGRGDHVMPVGPDEPPWPVKVKRWAVETIRSELPDASAALLAGLLLGERTALPRETDEAFRRAGVYHVLAVSGFNVALLAASVFGTLALVGLPRRAAASAAAVVLVGFALVVGGQPSVLRATVMGLLLLGSVILERESQAMNALALAAIALLLWSPGDLREPGFQLSFAATAGIIALAPPIADALRERGWPSWLAVAVAVSLGAQLAVMPVMLVAFNQLSLIGVLANLLVVPLAAPATTLGMLALLLSLISTALAALVFHALWLVLVALRAVVWIAAAVPNAMIHLPAPPWAAVAAWYAALALVPLAAGRRRVLGTLTGLALISVGLATWPWVAPGDGRLRVVFLDVGQGDAALIELPDGPRMLIDGGPGGPRRFDVGERVLAPVLWNRAVRRLDVVALSHADQDHSGGLAAIVRHFTVGEFWENGSWSPAAEETRLALEQSKVPRRVLRAGDRIRVGETLISVLNPDGTRHASPNDESLVFRLDWRRVSLLFTGDLGWEGEQRLRDVGAPLRALVLKVAHHGSRRSSSAPFIESVRPAFAVVSAGGRNPFRHPTPEVLGRLGAAGATVYRTDQHGAVIMETDGRRLWVTRWAQGVREAFDLDPQEPPDGDPKHHGLRFEPEAVVGRAESGRGQGPSVRS